MNRVLVTGGSGFIGRYVCEELATRGLEPVIYDHVRRHAPFEVYLGDIRDDVAVTEAVSHVEGVIHLGGVLGTQETINNPRPAAHTNILGGLNVLEACAEYGVPLVNIAVGNYWMNNTYSITKNAVERFCDMYATYRGLRVAVVRALNAYGPRQVAATPYGPSRVRKIMPSFACRALSGLPIEIYGDGEQVMDMIYVGDVAEILVDALVWTNEHGTPEGVLEAGTGRDTTVNQIAETVLAAAAEIMPQVSSVKHLPMRPGEPDRSVVLGDPAFTWQVLGQRDLVSLEDGAKRTVAYFADYLAER